MNQGYGTMDKRFSDIRAESIQELSFMCIHHHTHFRKI